MKKLLLTIASVLALSGCESESLVNTQIRESGDGSNRRAEIVNDTNIAIARLRVQNSATQTWSGNILVGKIRKNSSRIVLIDDGSGECIYNFRATMESGQTLARNGLDVCRLQSWTIFRR